MKLFLSVFIISVYFVILVTCAPNYDTPVDAEFHMLVRMCANEQAIGEEEAMNSMLVPMESPGDCVIACMWSRLRLIKHDGKINNHELMANIRSVLEEMPSISKLSDDVFYNCMDEGNKFDDKCDVVAGFFKCLVRDIFNLESISSN